VTLRCQVDGTGSVSRKFVRFYISGVEPSGSAATVLVKGAEYLCGIHCRDKTSAIFSMC
jgi:hypothetical protein